jgi:hypothetical protein
LDKYEDCVGWIDDDDDDVGAYKSYTEMSCQFPDPPIYDDRFPLESLYVHSIIVEE